MRNRSSLHAGDGGRGRLAQPTSRVPPLPAAGQLVKGKKQGSHRCRAQSPQETVHAGRHLSLQTFAGALVVTVAALSWWGLQGWLLAFVSLLVANAVASFRSRRRGDMPVVARSFGGPSPLAPSLHPRP